jgi:7-cyano-7-deazaguanine synthase
LAFALKPDICLTVDYGQCVAKAEIRASKNICGALQLNHETIKIDLRRFAFGSLAGRNQPLPNVAPEWWPFRNQVLITVAAMLAIKRGIAEVVIGTIKSDRRHRDGTKAFIKSMTKLIGMQEGNIRLLAPALRMSSNELIRWSGAPLGLLGLTFSCHNSVYPCGECRGCAKNEDAISNAIIKQTRNPRSSHA